MVGAVLTRGAVIVLGLVIMGVGLAMLGRTSPLEIYEGTLRRRQLRATGTAAKATTGFLRTEPAKKAAAAAKSGRSRAKRRSSEEVAADKVAAVMARRSAPRVKAEARETALKRIRAARARRGKGSGDKGGKPK